MRSEADRLRVEMLTAASKLRGLAPTLRVYAPHTAQKLVEIAADLDRVGGRRFVVLEGGSDGGDAA